MAGKRKSDTFSALNYNVGILMQKAALEMIPEIEAKAKDILWDVVYLAGTPEDYERTYELYESLRVDILNVGKKGSFGIKIFHDHKMIHYNPEANQHGTTEDVSQWIDNIVDEGASGAKFGYGYWMAERPYIRVIEDEIVASGWLQDRIMQKLSW